MNSLRLKQLISLTLFAALALAIPTQLFAQATAKHTRYTIIDLGPAETIFPSAGINSRGWVAGSTLLPDGVTEHAFLRRNGVKTDLGTLGGSNSNPFFGPSEKGQVVGQAETSTPDPLGEDFCFLGTHLVCLPFVWQSGVMTPLPTLGGNNGGAYSINNRNEAVGTAENTVPDATCLPPQVLEFKPVIWETGEIQELPTVSGDPDGIAFRINDKGQVVGASGNCGIFFHAVLWHDGTVTDLASLGGTMSNMALGINDRGQVVGSSNLPGDSTTHAFLWQNGVITDLGTFGGLPLSFAFGINNEGQVVGLSCDINFDCGAFLWEDGVMTDLNTLVPAGTPLFMFSAFDINSRGEIVGLGDLGTGVAHAFLAIPCDAQHADNQGCKDEGTAVTQGGTRQRTRIALLENVRKMLRQRLGLRYHIPSPGAPKN